MRVTKNIKRSVAYLILLTHDESTVYMKERGDLISYSRMKEICLVTMMAATKKHILY